MSWRVIWIPQLLGAVMSGIFVFRLGTGTVPRTVLHSCEEIAGMIRQNRNCENWIAKTENHLRRNGAKFHYGEKITPVKYLLIRLLIAFAGSLALHFVNDGTLLNHVKDYFRVDASNLGRGEFPDARAAAEDYVQRCAETAQEMAARG